MTAVQCREREIKGLSEIEVESVVSL
jgi:hypothetical protein